jgi:hypothetical protein
MSLSDWWKAYGLYRKVKDMKNPFGKKTYALLVGAVLQILGKQVGLTDDQIAWISGIIMSYILGQGVADMGKRKAIVEGETAIKLETLKIQGPK